MFPLHDTIPARNVPIVTRALIIVNCFIFVLELILPRALLEQVIGELAIVPIRFTNGGLIGIIGGPWCFLTSMFLHGGWMHLISNMWTLWIFGDNVEDRMGHIRFLVFYITCGIAAGIIHIIFNANSAVPTIGASGAIAGVLGAYFWMFPSSQVIVFFPLFIFWPIFYVMPAFLYLGLWFLLQFFSGTLSLVSSGSSAGGIAWWAHIGGFVYGLGTHRLFVKSRRTRVYVDEYGHKGAWFGM